MYVASRTREDFVIPNLDVTGMTLGNEDYSNVKIIIEPEDMSQFSPEQLEAIAQLKNEVVAKKAAVTAQTPEAEVAAPAKATEVTPAVTKEPKSKLYMYGGVVISVGVLIYGWYYYNNKNKKK